ncbi:DNA repair protein XRCC3 homolog [Linum perenne]
MMSPENLLRRLEPTEKLTLGSPAMDRCLGGGIPCQSITEIVAESGSGKTQLCLQLVLLAQLPPSLGGLSASSIYLHSEFPFPTRRLHQLAVQFHDHHREDLVVGRSYDPMDGVFVQSVHTADQLLDEMSRTETFLQNAKLRLPVRVIVIDSIAALFRSEFDNSSADLMKRSSLFFKISGKLKRLAWRFKLAIVVTNQVVDCVGDGVNGVKVGNLGSLCSSGRRVLPALGLAWSNCVNSRVFLSRSEDEKEEGERRTRRWLHLVFAPHLPPSSCEFVIRREGVSGIER